MDSTLLIIVVGAVCAGFVQGLSGFGFGLVAMSFWAWTLDPKLAAALAVFGAWSGQMLGFFSNRRSIDFKLLMPFLLGGLIGIPIGVWILPHLNVPLFKAILGSFLVIWCPTMLFADKLPPIKRGGRIGDAISGIFGGIMSGIGGFAGLAPTLWCTLRRFEKAVQRSVIQNFNLSVLSISLVVYLSTGLINWSMWPKLAVIVPAIIIPSLLGTKLYRGVSDVTFRRIVLGLLTASGIALLISAIPALLK